MTSQFIVIWKVMKFTLCFQKCREYIISFNRKKMCFYGIFNIDFGVHSFQGRKNTRPQKGSSNSEYASTYKPIAYSGL